MQRARHASGQFDWRSGGNLFDGELRAPSLEDHSHTGNSGYIEGHVQPDSDRLRVLVRLWCSASRMALDRSQWRLSHPLRIHLYDDGATALKEGSRRRRPTTPGPVTISNLRTGALVFRERFQLYRCRRPGNKIARAVFLWVHPYSAAFPYFGKC